MDPSDILRLYRARMRLKTVLVQEAFAILGIAVGVALLFSSQVASTSLTGSVERFTRGVVGNAQLQLNARGPQGFSEHTLTQVRHAAGVQSAFAVLEQQAEVRGPKGWQAVQLLGVDPRSFHFGGRLLRRLSAKQLADVHAVALPTAMAHSIGAQALEDIQVQVRGRLAEAHLGAILGPSEIGAAADGEIMVAPLAYAQRLAGMPGKVSRVFVRAAPGHLAQAGALLARLGRDAGANLQPATYDATLFRTADTTENDGETVFSAISALVGFMFALNAMLITVPARRKLIEDIHPQGATRSTILRILLFDAAAIGVFACLLGLGFGVVLSLYVFHSTPGYLAAAFPVGEETLIAWQTIALACLAGFGAAGAGVLWPLRDILAGTPKQTGGLVGGGRGRERVRAARTPVGLIALAITTAVLLFRTQSWFVGICALMVALVCLLPSLFDLAVTLFDAFRARFLDSPAAMLAVCDLRNPRTRTRSLAVALTGAIAVFGIVALGGAQLNLKEGLRASAAGLDAGADVWIGPRGQAGLMTMAPFRSLPTATLASVPGVAAVGAMQGSFLDWGERKLWVRAPPDNTKQALAPSQLVQGHMNVALARLKAGGWVFLSQTLAAEHHLGVGSPFVLPAPHPTRVRVAALITNLGWSPGAVIVGSRQYAASWGTTEPSAYEVQAKPGVPASVLRARLEHVVGPTTGLAVETQSGRRDRQFALIDQGLSQFTQIKLLVLIAGALAIAGAMGSTIWQRRGLMAFMKVDGYPRPILWRWLLWESSIMLLAGCTAGALFGLYGQLLISQALVTVTGLPVALGAETLIALASVLEVGAIVTAIVAMPGYLAVRVPAATSGEAW